MGAHAFSAAFSSAFNIEVVVATATSMSGPKGFMPIHRRPKNRVDFKTLPEWLKIAMRRDPARAMMILNEYLLHRKNTK